MIYKGIAEAIELIESRDKHPTMDSLKMAAGKLRLEQEIMTQLQSVNAGWEAAAKVNAGILERCRNACSQLAKDLATAKEENQSFGCVLALIHRDGGHYITKHGHEKASQDALQIVLDLRTELDRAKVENERLWKALGLANSMILSGETHTMTLRKQIYGAPKEWGNLATANKEVEKLRSRIKTEEEIRNDDSQEGFVDSDIDYLCMLASYGKTVVRAGWLKTFARKIKLALAEIERYKDVLATKFNAEMCEALKLLRAKNEQLEGIIVRFKATCKITGKGPVDKDCEALRLVKEEIEGLKSRVKTEEVMSKMFDEILKLTALNRHEDGSYEVKSLGLEQVTNTLHNLWVDLQFELMVN